MNIGGTLFAPQWAVFKRSVNRRPHAGRRLGPFLETANRVRYHCRRCSPERTRFFDSKDGQEWFADRINPICLNGEAFTEQIARTRSFLTEIRAMDHNRILVVTRAVM